jgi:hypothetical protein
LHAATAALALLPLLFWPPALVLAAKPQTDLNGFRLWQYVSGAGEFFGKPFKTVDQGESTLRAYRAGDHSYMVFETSNKKEIKEYVESLQISGCPAKMVPFQGLSLGDPKAKVYKVLGKPSKTKTSQDGHYTVAYYDPANYSVEFDDQDRLYSIKLWAYKKLFNTEHVDFTSWNHFRKAVMAKDVPAMLELFRPDAEIYINGKTLSPHGRAVDFFKHPDKAYLNALIGKTRSVRAAFKESEPTGEARLKMGMGVGQVYKFYKGTIVAEIVLFPYDGDYRIYEISFREKGDDKDMRAAT